MDERKNIRLRRFAVVGFACVSVAGILFAGGYLSANLKANGAIGTPAMATSFVIPSRSPEIPSPRQTQVIPEPSTLVRPEPSTLVRPSPVESIEAAPRFTPEQLAPNQAIEAPAPPSQLAVLPIEPKLVCPLDRGVTMTLTSVTPVYSGGVLDTYRGVITIDNRIGIPLELHPIDILKIAGVRSTGVEMGGGSRALETRVVQPGISTETLDDDDITTFHNFGSPVVRFELLGDVDVTNVYADALDTGLYCSFSKVVFGPPIEGNWGS
ncbi:hypothetical protein [Arthrobacter alpinus]|uniref:hypothetical protein n=1 Tax=Arthrobacter alpinus TaxID=656366 RepID=UPI000A853715|nr:hypothetical protein [Arthrobacter alpinus]